MKKNNLVFHKIPIEEIEIGMKVSYSQTITDADIKSFAGISGDRNPVHLDECYAKSSQFKKRIAHGMMTASFFSALFGTKIPGEGCVYTSQTLKFKRPVYIGDTVVASVEVTNVNIEKRRVSFRTACKVDSKIVTDGEAELFVPMEFTKKIIIDKDELKLYQEDIFTLFKHSFNQEIDESLWNWAYLENPNGNPIVSLYFDKEKLIGHYAVIPIKLSDDNNKNVDAVLSMTTMVDLSYRKYGIFINQANEVYDAATKLGYQLVIGFPNKKSAPGFKKRLNWVLEENLYVAKFNYKELQQFKNTSDTNCISFNTNDIANLAWRLNKPNQEYLQIGGTILKKFNNQYDIVFTDNKLVELEQNKEYNILVNFELGNYTEQKQFDYIFGYKLFDSSLEGVEFKKDLIMSDVF